MIITFAARLGNSNHSVWKSPGMSTHKAGAGNLSQPDNHTLAKPPYKSIFA